MASACIMPARQERSATPRSCLQVPLIMAGLIAVSILFSGAFFVVMLRRLNPRHALPPTAAEGLLYPVEQHFIPLCARRVPVSVCPSTRSGTLIGPRADNLLQPVKRKHVFRAAGDQTPAPVQALLGRALPAIPSPPGFRPQNRPVLPCGNLSGHLGKFWLGF